MYFYKFWNMLQYFIKIIFLRMRFKKYVGIKSNHFTSFCLHFCVFYFKFVDWSNWNNQSWGSGSNSSSMANMDQQQVKSFSTLNKSFHQKVHFWYKIKYISLQLYVLNHFLMSFSLFFKFLDDADVDDDANDAAATTWGYKKWKW